MTAEIKNCVSKCETCNSYKTNQQKEPLIPHDPPKRPWPHVATDLFSFDNKDWFIIVDHWSYYFDLNQLQWNPVNTVTNGPKKFGRNNEVTVLKKVSLQENVWSFWPGSQKKWP